MKILTIDTSDNKEIAVGIIIDGKEYVEKDTMSKQKPQVTLPLVEAVLNKKKLSLSDIDAIKVNVGPGSYTGLRVGVAIANTLGFLLHIPINGKPVGELTDPIYT